MKLKAHWIASLPPAARQKFLNDLRADHIEELYWHWPFWARADQLPPDSNWTSWLVLGGRGAGKTRAGAEWVRAMVASRADGSGPAYKRIALIGETLGAVRAVMVEGPSGLLAISPSDERPQLIASRQLLLWPNGAEARLFSAERPESLRGPQFDAAWCDELAKWRHDEETWDMLQFGLRLGTAPRQVATTTPKPTTLIKRLLGDPHCAVTRAPTQANAAHLAPGFLSEIVERYGGTRLGRQELEAELLEDVAGALWDRDLLERQRRDAAPELARVIVAVDPPVGSGPKADHCGVIIIGKGSDGKAYLLDDRSVQGLSPAGWAARVVAAYHDYQADMLVAEVNQGGELIEELVLRIAPEISFKPLRAIRGKLVRAEPVAALYERGRVFHIGRFERLEDQMCSFDGTGGSPDRLDALVWGVTHLLLRRTQSTVPKMRRL